jgi:hypothetical protein
MLGPARYQVNLFKGATALWVLLLMGYFRNWSPAMWLYLCLHGSYGLCWILKDLSFPDPRLKNSMSAGSHIILFLLLAGYWAIPVPLALGLGLQ